jgi:hypothetical protein
MTTVNKDIPDADLRDTMVFINWDEIIEECSGPENMALDYHELRDKVAAEYCRIEFPEGWPPDFYDTADRIIEHESNYGDLKLERKTVVVREE